MNWLILALISAGCMTVATLLEKKALFNIHAAAYATALTAMNAFFALFLIPFIDFSTITPLAWVYIGCFGVFNATGFLLIAKAMRHTEVSYLTPMLNFSPAITAIFAFFLLNERLTLWQASGIGLIVLGSYALHASHHKGVWKTMKDFFSSRAQHFVWFALLLYGISAIGTKHMMNIGITPLTLMVLLHIVMTLTLYIILKVKYNGLRDLELCWKTAGATVVITGLFIFVARISLFIAFSLTSIGLAIAIKRMGSLFVTMFGGELFHEHNLVRRIAASAIMVAGAILLV